MRVAGTTRVILISTLAIMVASLTCGGAIHWWHRSASTYSIRCLMLVVLLVACWLAFFENHSTLSWHGARYRMLMGLQALEPLAVELSAHWPAADSQLDSVGPFMAYPEGDPRTLILLKPPNLNSWGTQIIAVDRSEAGVLRFQLAGYGYDDWVERHPALTQPTSFVGGLNDHHQIEQSLALEGGWHLVRYSQGT